MQFIDLKAQYLQLQDKINGRIRGVLEHGKYIMGPEVSELESKLSEYVGVKHAVTCANGTDALQLALMAMDIGPGDAVFTTPFTFFATAEVISLVGATPIFVDIDERTYNIDHLRLEAAIEEIIDASELVAKAVISVDLFGLPADYEKLEPLCKRYKLKLIEDAAQGFGGEINGRRSGSFGDIATTSFFPAKPLGCYGDGGAIFTNSDDLAKKIKSLRIHGKGEDKYDNIAIGINSRLDTIQAAILLEKLAIFPREVDARQLVAKKYSDKLKDKVVIPYVPPYFQSSWAQYSVLAKDSEKRKELMAAYKKQGIPTVIYYSKPLHLQGAFEYLGIKEGAFPISESVSQRIFSLPMHPYLCEKQQDKIISVL